MWQPHFRLIYAFGVGILLSCLGSAKILSILTACSLCLLLFLHYFYHQSYRAFFYRWLKLNLFTLCIWLTLSWQVGEAGITWNEQGIRLATFISLRMNAIMLVLWVLLWQVNEIILVQAIAKLPLPTKFIHLFVLTVRFIAVLGEINQKMDLAMKARGYQPRCNSRTLLITAQKVALLLIHALVRAEKAEIALKARGFQFRQTKNDT